MNYKEYHKELKKKVNIVEQVRNEDRTNKTWVDVRTLKKLKLKESDKLNETKSCNNFFLLKKWLTPQPLREKN